MTISNVTFEEESILKTIRNYIGLDKEDNSFDGELLTYINLSISELHQAGLSSYVYVSGPEQTWSSLLRETTTELYNEILGSVISYIGLKVKILFDPPAPNTQNIMKSVTEECIWRISVAYTRHKDTIS